MEQRARGWQASERAEFLRESGHDDLADVLQSIHTEDTPVVIANLLMCDIVRHNGGEVPNLDVPSDMYEEGSTLAWTLIEWCKEWGCGGGEPHEQLEDIELEIDICLSGESE